MNVDFWNGFNPETERAYVGPDGPTRVKISAAVLLLRTMEPTDAEVERGEAFASRVKRATELSANGHVIDTQIDVWGWGAENTMKLRRMYGYDSVPDATGRVQILVSPQAPK